MRAVVNLGVDPDRILFANPCKAAASLVFAQRARIFKTTFDNIDELDTIKTHMPSAQLFLRIYANDNSALIGLGEKFGAHLDTTPILLARARDLGLDLVGVSFHVAFCRAIRHARIAFSYAREIGFRPTILDIGGGFQDDSFEGMAALIRETIRSEFPAGVVMIAEPGRFYARAAYTLVCRVIARRRQIGAAGDLDMLYQNDGVYGNFMNVIMEKEVVHPQVIRRMEDVEMKETSERKTGQCRYSIWGPTCDSVDCVARDAIFSSEVCIGDWLKYADMGGMFDILIR
ncbi:Ornithine decarboxylase [Penicillium capsulatum]|uniref:Ornithine decarboxylase n=1 Tax=Penicillium capsulatum TaxID=69766 RepID=A0A9W9IS99_9EURO|nr:Ornithine decarboxylase [Penicillium capsulatum]